MRSGERRKLSALTGTTGPKEATATQGAATWTPPTARQHGQGIAPGVIYVCATGKRCSKKIHCISLCGQKASCRAGCDLGTDTEAEAHLGGPPKGNPVSSESGRIVGPYSRVSERFHPLYYHPGSRYTSDQSQSPSPPGCYRVWKSETHLPGVPICTGLLIQNTLSNGAEARSPADTLTLCQRGLDGGWPCRPSVVESAASAESGPGKRRH